MLPSAVQAGFCCRHPWSQKDTERVQRRAQHSRLGYLRNSNNKSKQKATRRQRRTFPKEGAGDGDPEPRFPVISIVTFQSDGIKHWSEWAQAVCEPL